MKDKCPQCGQPLEFRLQFHPDACCVSYQAGIKEVTDWVNGRWGQVKSHYTALVITREDWKEKLKEWGVE